MSDELFNEQEYRFAVVLYGGVSLAIYINGVAQEMRNLVRATSGEPFSDDEERGTAPVYQRLASILRRGVIPDSVTPAGAPVPPSGTKFVVDVISGTSAGGINGIFLAKSLATNRPMTGLQNLWIEEGSIEKLLNDEKSDAGTNLNRPEETQSLLNSRRMYLKLLNAFDGMDDSDRSKPSDETSSPQFSLGDEIDLFATTTDIEGVPVPIQLFDTKVYERRYRNAYHLQYRKGIRNDFQADNNPFLAFASRSTSSFPFAFEPMRLCSMDEILEHSPIYANRIKDCRSSSDRWQKYYTNYLSDVLPGSTAFPQRSFGDGGYLNNAPFSYAVDALMQRQSEVPVTRKLIYVEPSPDHVEEEPVMPGPPDAIQNSVDALITIPGYQTIRNDLTRVLERNRTVAKINKTLSEVEAETEARIDVAPGSEKSTEEIWFSEEISMRAYYRMRSSEVTDQFARMIAKTRSIDTESALFFALRSLIRAWRQRRFKVAAEAAGRTEDKLDLQELIGFLREFDLPYRLRRLRFVARKLDVLYAVRFEESANPSKQEAMATLQFGMSDRNAVAELPEGLPEVRRKVGSLFKDFKALEDDLLRDSDAPKVVADVMKRKNAGVTLHGREYVLSVIPSRETIVGLLEEILNGPARGGNGAAPADGSEKALFATKATKRNAAEPADLELLCDQRAQELLEREPGVFSDLQDLGNTLSAQLALLLAKGHAGLYQEFIGSAAGRIAGRLYANFDLFDAIQFPMMFGTDVVSTDTVDILRIAPEDAGCLIQDVAQRRKKLKGLAVAHFGAFLDCDWRVSDLLWGRLDAAERLITAMLPFDQSLDVRNQLIDEAQNAIFVDFEVQTRLKEMAVRQVAAQGPANKISDVAITNLLQVVVPEPVPVDRQEHIKLMQIWQDIVPKEMERKSALQSIARSTTIFGKMLEAISAKRQAFTQAGWVTKAGRAFWGVVEISVPRSTLRDLANYWQSLLLLIAIILIICSFLISPAVAGFGWSLLLFSVLLFVVRAVLGSYMRGGKSGPIKAVAALLLLLVLGAGVWQMRTWFVYIKREATLHANSVHLP